MSQIRNHAKACCIQVELWINDLNICQFCKSTHESQQYQNCLEEGLYFSRINLLQKYKCLQGYVYMQLIASPGCKCKLDLLRTIKNQLFQNRGGIHNQINLSLISVFLYQFTGIMVVQCDNLVQTFNLGTISQKSWFQTVFKMIKIYMLLSLKYSLI
ncbi:Hypothetical_protein [Hexamita inflata]|uniref:Hypothetical_protein n=1 Tax=Hexamita inflata TaxID=28002 RepID=A0AA86RE00_9EUKA|nr:Hypothetical protein HINF_LOCUS64249 [Hexamita inflata]